MKLARSVLTYVMDSLEAVAFVGSIYIVIFLFLAFPTQVKGASMEPTIHAGDRIILNKVSVRLGEVKRGDIIAFRSPYNPDVEFIKRVIALPYDKISVKNGVVQLNGHPLYESYIRESTNLWEDGYLREGETISVPDRSYFVMGDNRLHSLDSRQFGFVSFDSVVGKAVYRFYPPQSIGFFP